MLKDKISGVSFLYSLSFGLSLPTIIFKVSFVRFKKISGTGKPLLGTAPLGSFTVVPSVGTLKPIKAGLNIPTIPITPFGSFVPKEI